MQYSQTMEPDSVSASVSQVGRNWLEVAWRRKALIVLATAVALVLGLLIYAQTTPVYQSKAQILVVKKRPDDITGINTRQMMIEDYAATHKTLLESPLIVKRAIDRRTLSNLESLEGKEDLTEAIIKQMTISRNKGAGATATNVLDLAFRGIRAEECNTVLTAVIESYKDFLDETYRDSSEDTVKLIIQERDHLQKDLRKTEEAYGKFRKEAPVLLAKGKDGGSLPQERLGSLEAKRGSLLARKAEVQGHVYAIDTGLKNGSREALLAMLADIASKGDDPTRPHAQMTLQSPLYALLNEEQRLLEMRGEQHPEVQMIRKRIEMTRDFLGNPTAAWRKAGPAGTAPEDPVEMYREYFQQQLNHILALEEKLGKLLEDEHQSARALMAYEIEDERFRAAISRDQEMHKSIIKKLQEVSLVKNVGGYDAKTIAPPTLGKKVQPSATMIFPVALLLGLLGGFGLAYLAEVTDKSFRSVEEVRRRLGVPVVGQIPFLKSAAAAREDKSGLSPVLCTYHRPKSSEAEAYRGVRTAIYFSTRGEAHKVIQVTSPSAGDGKSTLAANLAVSMAQSGKHTLLIDADLRKPTIHKLFGLAADVGLGSIMAGEVEWKDAVQETAISKLSVLPCGPLPPNPAELLTSPRFEEFLDLLRDEYDFVLVDTPPLLLVTDPSVVAARVDGVLLNIRIGKNARPQAERAKDILDTLGARVFGVVVNDADSRTSGANYGYGYGYGYTDDQHTNGANGTSQGEAALAGVREEPAVKIARVTEDPG